MNLPAKSQHIFNWLIGIMVALLSGCTAQEAAVRRQAQPGSSSVGVQAASDYIIQPGDQLDVKFFFNPELNETIPVRPDGKISLQLIDDVQAAGLAPAQLDTVLTRMYVKELQKPVVTVIVKSFTGQRVYVGGEVANQRLVNLTVGMTPLQAVIDAGGFKETAKPEAVIVIRKGSENQPIPHRVNLKQTLDGMNSVDFSLQPYDIVYVPKTWIAEANKFVNEYIERLLLFKGTSLGFGFTYELNDNAANR
jgi:protein involved in polysaccharide export with SLBB domain